MMNRLRTIAAAGRGDSSPWIGLLAGFFFLITAMHAVAQAPAAPGGAAPPTSAEELAKLVGPIALYPDDLVAIILPAATNPLQLVQADRYLDKRKADPKLPVDDKWDDSVKSLLNYPDVVKTMSADLDWTSALGRSGRHRPGRGAGRDPGVSPQGAGRGQPQVRRQAGRGGREGDRHHRARPIRR